MSLSFISDVVKVATTPDVVLRFKPSELHSLVIKADLAMELGGENLSVGTGGAPLSAGEAFGIKWDDFDQKSLKPGDIIDIRGIAPVATTARIFRFMK